VCFKLGCKVLSLSKLRDWIAMKEGKTCRRASSATRAAVEKGMWLAGGGVALVRELS